MDGVAAALSGNRKTSRLCCCISFGCFEVLHKHTIKPTLFKYNWTSVMSLDAFTMSFTKRV